MKLTPLLAAATAILGLLMVAPAVLSLPSAAPDLLPALSPVQSALADNDLVQDPQTGHILLRFTNDIANTGGTLYVVGYRDRPSSQNTSRDDDRMPAYQRVFRSDGTYHDEPVGELVYHPLHHHFHFVGAAQYRLLDPSGASPTLLMSSEKVSFCLADVAVIDDSVPGYSHTPKFNSCAHAPYATSVAMGISPGWADVYDRRLAGQAFDVTDLMSRPAQWYTLESTTNPAGLLHEANTDHPVTVSTQVWIGQGVDVGVGRSRPGV